MLVGVSFGTLSAFCGGAGQLAVAEGTLIGRSSGGKYCACDNFVV